ncbi:MAG TPA: formate dehydrogenase accessory sulfurtransferase FdhD [Mucilaginibacter sp.]|nr:formate dehydrogenase accessory sulfurtransferase FdhD [Mucilaginibacter sp.]
MSIKKISVTRVSDTGSDEANDALAVEEPLEIRLGYIENGEKRSRNISVTMRTPGNDLELATGFLFTEGIIKRPSDITDAGHISIACIENRGNIIEVQLNAGVTPILGNLERNFYTTSSCGVCGKGSINAIRTVGTFAKPAGEELLIQSAMLYRLPNLLRQEQHVFETTGGLHASALFDHNGKLLAMREDVGRHNALDKLIGASLREDMLSLDKRILLLSGRASFELIQKAVMAGIRVVASVGAPSSLAVELAEEFDVTLIGFLRDRRFNIYTAARRVLLPLHENSD